MAKLAIILPHDNLASAAALLLQEMHMEHVPIIHFSGNPEEIPYLVDWAKKQGAEIILTRGLIATRARRFSNISVVEMRSSAQELGLLIQKAKELIRKKDPVIALVGTANMFSDYSRLGELFGVTLLSYLIPQDDPDPYSSLEKLALQAIEDRADLVIGGNTACRTAQKNGVPYLFLAATEESLREGLRLARRISYAIDQEKNNAFEIQAMLDSSFSILIRFDRNGFIKAVNRSAITRFNWKQTDFRGKPVQSLFSGLTQQQLQQVLYAGKTLHSVFIHIGEEQFVANLTPVRTAEGTIIGGVLSCDEVSRIENVSVSIRREQQRLLHPALRSFDSLICRSPQMRQLREAAEIFAQSDSPILIQTGPGYDPLQLAECIHNASPRKDMPFVTVDCAALRPEEQLRYIFGSFDAESRLPQSLCAVAHLGTLYLQNPEHLCPEAQNRLFRLVTQKNLMNPETASAYPLDVRIIGSSELPVSEWTQNGMFSQNLLTVLNGLSLTIPPLRDCPEDLEHIWQERTKKYLEKHHRFLTITEGGREWFLSQKWPGNFLQLDRFCERLVLSAPRKSVDERLLSSLYRKSEFPDEPPVIPAPSPVYIPPEAAEIAEALKNNLGNRRATAQALGISTSTLWRKMNKYNIDL